PVRRRLLDGDDDGVPQRGIPLVGASHHPDALNLLGSGVVGDVEHRAGLDHRQDTRLRTLRIRQRFYFEIGAVFSINPRSPTRLSLVSSCALSFFEARTTR